MSIANAGIALRNFRSGVKEFQGIRNREEEMDWRENRRNKTETDEAFYDPLRREKATIGMNKARRDERFDSENEERRLTEAEWNHLQAQREAELGEKGHEGAMAGIGQRDRAAERKDVLAGLDQPYAENRIRYQGGADQRQDDLGRAGHEGAIAGIRYADERAAQENELANAQAPGKLAQVPRDNAQAAMDHEAAKRQELYGQGDMADYQKGQTYESYMDNAAKAVQNLEATGNPIAIQTFYNDMYDDDGEITITKNPDGTYTGDYGDGNVVPNIPKDELVAKTKEFFEAGAPPRGGMGMGIGGGYGMRGGMSGERGKSRGRSGMTTQKDSAWEKKVMALTRNNIQSKGMDEVQAYAEAIKEAGYESQKSPQEAGMEFYAKMLENLMPDDKSMIFDQEGDEPGDAKRRAMDEAEAEAIRLTEKYMGIDFSGYNGGSGGGIPTGGQQEAQGTQIPEHDQQMLKDRKDEPGIIEMFDDTYGPGAAEQVLNGEQ
ncbi:hypothetical protein N9937_01675 [bacterium]|nr:hypothetical protein [bacterium]